MSEFTVYIVIGVAIAGAIFGFVALIRADRQPRSVEQTAIYPMQILGIVFLFPGVLNLILHGEYSVFLSLGIIFTLSGLVANLLIRPAQDPGNKRQTLVGSLIGFTVGGSLGAAVSMVFEFPPVPLILLVGAVGLLVGMVVGLLQQRRDQI